MVVQVTKYWGTGYTGWELSKSVVTDAGGGESKNPFLGVRRSFPLARKSKWMTVLWCQGTETLIGTKGGDHCDSYFNNTGK